MLALLSAGCASLVPPPAAAPATANEAASAWATVLARFVDERGEVDFQALVQDRDDLDRMLRCVADTLVESLPEGAARLAHFINAYNALSMFTLTAPKCPLPRPRPIWPVVRVAF